MTRLARPASFLALLILLAGCGATPPGTGSPGPSPGRSNVGAVAAPGSNAGPPTEAAGKPPASAAMICDADIKSKVREALGLAGPPSTEWRWSNGVYTCDYHLPMGRMSLQVTILAGASQARTLFDADQARTPGAVPLAGLGSGRMAPRTARSSCSRTARFLSWTPLDCRRSSAPTARGVQISPTRLPLMSWVAGRAVEKHERREQHF